MRDRPVRSRNVVVLRLLLVLPLLLALTGGAEGKKPRRRVPWTGPVPKADCGPNDRVETGLQGQTMVAERMSGASLQAYNCNLELVGQFTGEGTEWQMAWFDDCAYDIRDPYRPREVAYYKPPAVGSASRPGSAHAQREPGY